MTRTAIKISLGLTLGVTLGLFWPVLTGGLSGIFSETASIRYRFPVSKTDRLSQSILALEERVRSKSSAFTLAELSAHYFQLGHTTGDTQWFDKAEDSAKKSLALIAFPNPAKLTLALVADARHQFAKAIHIAEEIQNEKTSLGAMSVLVTSHLALGNLSVASHYADQAVEAKPTLSAYLLRALVNQAQGRDEEALFDFSRAAAVEDFGEVDESARLRSLWGRFLLRRGNYKEAEKLFDESLRICPQNQLALGLQGELALRTHNANRAALFSIQAFEASKQVRYLVRYARAKDLGHEKQAEEVRQQAEKLIRADLAKGHYGHQLELVELLLDKTDPKGFAEAVELCKAETLIRKNAETLFLCAKSYWKSGRLDEALSQIQTVLRSGVRDKEYFELASEIEKARGNHLRAKFYSTFPLRNRTG